MQHPPAASASQRWPAAARLRQAATWAPGQRQQTLHRTQIGHHATQTSCVHEGATSSTLCSKRACQSVLPSARGTTAAHGTARTWPAAWHIVGEPLAGGCKDTAAAHDVARSSGKHVFTRGRGAASRRCWSQSRAAVKIGIKIVSCGFLASATSTSPTGLSRATRTACLAIRTRASGHQSTMYRFS